LHNFIAALISFAQVPPAPISPALPRISPTGGLLQVASAGDRVGAVASTNERPEAPVNGHRLGIHLQGRAPLSGRSMVEGHRSGAAERHAGHVQSW
jgi:hypothetical protein